MKLLILFLFSSLSFAAPQTPTPNPEMQKILDKLKDKNSIPVEMLNAEKARNQPSAEDAAKDVIKKEEGSYTPRFMAKIKEKKIHTKSGKVRARIYTPQGETPMPVIVYFHGGGFVIGTNDTYDASARALADEADSIVVAVEYRKAPEHKFPQAHDDAFEAYKWVLKNAKDLGGDPQRIAVAGESAGGNLALNVALKARDEKVQLPVHELLIYPVVGSDMSTESYKTNAFARPLSREGMNWFLTTYINSPNDLQDVRLNLLKADFKGLAPATIISAEIDPLRTEDQLLAEKMRAQGIKVDYRNYQGVTHEFFGMAPVLKEAKEAQQFASNNLKQSFEKQAQEEKKKGH